jgi:drug/metabolite transporter (DMT)-like permease
MRSQVFHGAAYALASALLFGASTPFAKALLGTGTDATLLAGLLYVGSGAGLSLVQLSRQLFSHSAREAPVRLRDWPRLLGAVVLGGALAPLCLMAGLKSTEASSAALLLNLEGVATMAIAWLVFRESVDRRLLLGAFAIVAGASLLAWSGRFTPSIGALLVVLACLFWGMDNNLTRGLSGSDPEQIALIKGLVAGGANTALAFAAGATVPAWHTVVLTCLLGFFGYGISLVLFVKALRYLGAARTSAYFSTAPFIGALIAVAMYREPVTLALVAAALFMAVGLYLHLSESHEHMHSHDALEHEHQHVHDEHHQHEHPAGTALGDPHSHWHRHQPLKHTHRHYPDLHHHHEH